LPPSQTVAAEAGDDGHVTAATAIRMVATDLDGTLLRRDGTVSARTVAGVKSAAAAGLTVVLVTARPPRGVDHIAAQLACHPLAICSNGALNYDGAERQLIAENQLGPADAAEIVRRLRSVLDGIAIAVEAGLRYGQEPHYPAYWPVPADALIGAAEALIAAPVAKLIVRHGDGDHWELVTRARQAVGDLGEVTSSGLYAPIEITAAGVSKAAGLEFLGGRLGVGPDAVLALGDMPNDLPMLSWAGRTAAPANSHPDVLAMADEVTADCDDDGVALVIEALLAQTQGQAAR
jgi:HAD superfamily hydrolase (TIGR01484 family)